MTLSTLLQKPSLKQKQQQSQEQSLQIVQIMLHASFGTLFYLREFLPLSCFGECDLLHLKSDTLISYDSYVSRGIESVTKASSRQDRQKRSQPLKVILRGYEPSADKVLNLLENGVFHALSKNILEAVQLTVLADKAVPSQVLESYTFTFRYSKAKSSHGNSDDVNGRLASISLNATSSHGTGDAQDKAETTEMNNMRAAKKGMEMIIRRLITLSSVMPRLPNERYLEIHLFYTDDCPVDYEPPGFCPTKEGPIIFPGDELWAVDRQNCGVMDTGFHSVGIKISSLEYRGQLPENGEAPRIPSSNGVRFTRVVSRRADVGMDEAPTRSTCSTEEHAATSRRSTLKEPPRNDSKLSSQPSTQARQDEMTKRLLQEMALPSTPASDLVPTQVQPQSLHNIVADAGDSLQSSSYIQHQLPSMKLELSQLKLKNLHSQIQDGYLGHGTDSKNKVDCQCGWGEVDGIMLHCAFCLSSQHALCYGFLDPENSNTIPDVHCCYKCLLQENEPKLLHEMSTLVMLRLALKIIIENGYPCRLKDFANMLHCNGQTVVQITDLLKKQGYIQANPRSKAKGAVTTGKAPYRVPLMSTDIREKLRSEVFNPLAKIGHHYLIKDENEQRNTSQETGEYQRNGADNSVDIRHQRAASISSTRVYQTYEGQTSKLPQAGFGNSEGEAGDIEMLEVKSLQERPSQGGPATVANSAISKKRLSSGVTGRVSSPDFPSSPQGLIKHKRLKLSNCRSPIDIRFAESDGLQENHDGSDTTEGCDDDGRDDDLTPR